MLSAEERALARLGSRLAAGPAASSAGRREASWTEPGW